MNNIAKILMALQVSAPSEQMQATVVDVARQSGNFNTLVKAIEKADLIDTLKGRGPFTIFAPNDDAFNKLPQDTLNKAMSDRDMLTGILKNHVVKGRYTSRDLSAEDSLKTMQGNEIPVSVSGDKNSIGDARIIQKDVMASNGIIHVIDSVLVPK